MAFGDLKAGAAMQVGGSMGTFTAHEFNAGGIANINESFDKTSAKAKPFLLKIQSPAMGSGPLMVYNADRSYSCFIPPTDPSHAALLRAMRQSGLFGGLKGYFWAKVDDAMRLTVAVDSAAPPQPW